MRGKLGFLGVVFFGFAASALLVVLGLGKPSSTTTALAPARAAGATSHSTTPQLTPASIDVFNSDASRKLTQKTATFTDHSDNIVYISKSDGSGQKILFNKTLPPGATITIPGNSWSPDYKEIFLILKNGSLRQFLVLNTSGEPYAQGDKFLEITSAFTKSNSSLTLKDVTGWDGYGLLHVETANPDGSRGPRFWFVTGTRQFLELAKAPNE